MQQFNLVVNYLIAHWPAILSLIGGGAGLSVIAEFLFHKLHVNSKKLAYTIVHLMSALSAISLFIITNDQMGILKPYAGLVIAAQTFHRFVVSPVYVNTILPYLQYRETLKQTVSAGLEETPVAAPVAATDEFAS